MEKTISFYRSDSQLMNDAIDRVVVEIYRRKKEENKKTFLLTGVNSACGTTTNAINIAIALSIAGWKTVLIDCDLRKGLKYKRLSDKTKSGLADYLNSNVKESDVVYPTSYNNMFYIPRGTATESPIRLLATAKMEGLITSLQENYDFVILDMPSINAVSDAEILMPIADAIMLVVGMRNSTKKQLADAKDKLLPYEEKYMGILANSVDEREYKQKVSDYDYFTKDNMDERHKKYMKNAKKKKK